MTRPFPSSRRYYYAAAREGLLSTEQIVSKTYLLILQRGIYGDVIRIWHRRLLVKKTCTTFKLNFKEVYIAVREFQIATRNVGIHCTNAAVETLHAETISTLSNTAQAECSTADVDRIAVANMAQAILTLLEQKVSIYLYFQTSFSCWS